MALMGPAGAGKTWTALVLATALAGDGRVLVIDTERGSASKYADAFEFDVIELERFHPRHYIEALTLAQTHGYAVCVVDSLSHAWAGKDGILDQVSQLHADKTFTEGWRRASPLHHRLVDTLLQAPLHLIATLRSKMAYVLETNERGKQVPRKVGLQPIQRPGLEYEFDVVADLDVEHTLTVSKTRCPALNGIVMPRPGPELAQTLKTWLGEAVKTPEPPAPPPPSGSVPNPAKEAILGPIKQAIRQFAPGDNDEARAQRMLVLCEYFDVKGWTALEALPVGILQEGYAELVRWETLRQRALQAGMSEEAWASTRAVTPYDRLEALVAQHAQPR